MNDSSRSGERFVAELVGEMEEVFARLREQETLESESGGRPELVTLLKLAASSELEAAELAGSWLPSTPELPAKELFAAQCGEEMRHLKLILERLAELGEDVDAFDPGGDGPSPLQEYLRGLDTTVERIAAGPFAREAIARVRNDQFIAFCRAADDETTARLYEELIQPEEQHHHEVGRRLLERYAVTPESREAAAAAVRNTLAIADELRTLMERTTGGRPVPLS
ncbi:MAG: ferritin-like domain-containing protein [Thermoanaerobaculia bacterium]